MHKSEFRNFAVKGLGMNGLALDQYSEAISSSIRSSYINPSIIEERELNVAQMDVFSRLMMDRIIFLGTEVNDYTANVIQASCFSLTRMTPARTCLFILIRRRLSICRPWNLRHHAVYIERRSHNMHRYGSFDGSRAPRSRPEGQAFCTPPLSCDDSPAHGRRAGSGFGY